ncbi:hypothetical protein TNCT_530861 [Trichonephila clavata]|uniref:Uncharacterized protein n=1 Tax=Trichonephila clavata TaxID=2740835 RepID=A0A8X6L440_TRICU|nr:hypothetical protein TNCT_530861 [Trichonephila clavata]
MSPSHVDRDALIAEKITNVLEQDLKHYISKVYGVSSVFQPKDREKINKFKRYVKETLTTTVCALDEGLNDLIMSIRNREATAGGTVAANSAATQIDTPLGDLFASTLIEQASKISASMESINLEFPTVEKNFLGQLSDKKAYRLGLIQDILWFNEFYSKKIKVFFIDMEEHLKKILSGISVEGKEDFSLEEREVDLVLNSKPLVNTIMVEMKSNDIIENFWKQFIDKYFSGKVSSANTESSTRLNKESEYEVSPYINTYVEWKYSVNEYLIKDIEQIVSDFVKIITGDGAGENETFSSSALICMEHFEELRRKIDEESSRPEKEIESEIGQFIELADSNEQRVKGRVLKAEALESCKFFMRSQREDMIKYVNKQQKSILTKGFTFENLRKYSSHENDY